METYYRNFIEKQLFTSKKSSSSYGEQITPIAISSRLQKIISKSLGNSPNLMTISKIGLNIQNNSKQPTQNIEKNQLFIQTVNEISTLIFRLAYSHPIIYTYPKYNIQNIIAFYEISKWIYHSQNVFSSKQLKNNYNKEVIQLFFTQKIFIFKDVYYRIEQSQIFRNFIEELFLLIGHRIEQMFKLYGLTHQTLKQTCMLHIKSFIQKYQMTQSSRNNPIILTRSPSQLMNSSVNNQALSRSVSSIPTQTQNEQFLNSVSIDQLIICFTYLIFRMSHQFKNIRMSKLIERYYEKILKWKHWKEDGKITQFYNNYYLKFYLSNKIQKIHKFNIQFDEEKADYYLARLVQSGQSILDNFVSSFEA